MNLILVEAIDKIYKILLQFVPLFRVVWIISSIVGIVLLIVAFALKRNPIRKKSPWIVGGIGISLFISSGTQLITSLL